MSLPADRIGALASSSTSNPTRAPVSRSGAELVPFDSILPISGARRTEAINQSMGPILIPSDSVAVLASVSVAAPIPTRLVSNLALTCTARSLEQVG